MEGFADIEGPLRIGLLWIFLYAAAALLVVLLLYLLYRMNSRRRAAHGAQSGAAMRSPLDIALERLDHLREDGSRLEADPFVVEVSDIVRDYLERALALPAREQTSEEFLNSLQRGGNLPEVLQTRMPDFLGRCDMVKFARQSLQGGQRDSLLQTAGEVVTGTDASLRPAPESKAKEADA